MSEYVFLYRNGPQQSPEVMQRQMERWRAWMKQLADQGALKDFGHPLERAGKVVSDGGHTVTDGLFAEAKDLIGGYSLVTARDIDHAVEISKGCPILLVGGAIEVRPTMQI